MENQSSSMETFQLVVGGVDILQEDNLIFDNLDPENINEYVENNATTSENGQRKRRKKNSPVWAHFSEVSIDGADWGQCSYCVK